MLLADLAAVSAAVAATSSRLEKARLVADRLARAAPEEVPVVVAMLSGEIRGGRVRAGPALLSDARPGGAAATPTLGVLEAQEALRRVAAASGRGSREARRALLGGLLARATPAEQAFLIALVVGELRQGALEGVMVDAVARAARVPASDVRRAAMLAGGLPDVAGAALAEGSAGLARFRMRLFQPVQPMLAQSADDAAAAIERLGRASLEHKLDGARVQVHKGGDEVRVYTRRLNDVTASVPEIVAAARSLAARELVLDGEVLALGPGGAPRPFQETMRRFGRKLDVERVRRALPLDVFLFDALLVDGEELLDRPAEERLAALAEAVPERLRVPRATVASAEEAERFLAEALRRGQEGVMAKDLAAPYEAGRRGSAWLKVKPAQTLDLVVLAAEWGHGRRRGLLSNLHLGARDPAGGGFVMLGKTFKGLSDEMLAWQTERLLALETHRDEWTVHVRPELVVEIAVNELQRSPRYPGGLALRFARVKRHRPDKRATDADTLATVRALGERDTEPGSRF